MFKHFIESFEWLLYAWLRYILVNADIPSRICYYYEEIYMSIHGHCNPSVTSSA